LPILQHEQLQQVLLSPQLLGPPPCLFAIGWLATFYSSPRCLFFFFLHLQFWTQVHAPSSAAQAIISAFLLSFCSFGRSKYTPKSSFFTQSSSNLEYLFPNSRLFVASCATPVKSFVSFAQIFLFQTFAFPFLVVYGVPSSPARAFE
jgi:hypothetical protein